MSEHKRSAVRAKYRILSRLERYNGTVEYRLGAVLSSNDHDESDKAIEDRVFHEASPSGESMFVYHPGNDPGFEIGAYYYLDFTPLDGHQSDHPKRWIIEKVINTNSQFDVKLTPRGSKSSGMENWNSYFEVAIDPTVTHAADCFGLPDGRPWALEVTFAEASDG